VATVSVRSLRLNSTLTDSRTLAQGQVAEFEALLADATRSAQELEGVQATASEQQAQLGPAGISVDIAVSRDVGTVA